ncbi:Crp/Fnr family transcriptional regulator [Reichenbachiella agariperforans]|uniref:Crp/Fnr family transcriptional regulator n=1 Tax=Reichenbachiella agariperforans TaxID=156994 RepID=UPI00093491FA|nr:Crp/Fnr family transcriptional regulator [Reichenbachiella agariperforans]
MREKLREYFEQDLSLSKDVEEVVNAFEHVVIDKNDYLFNAGSTIDHYYILEEGFVRSFAIDTKGNDITTHFFSKGEIVIDWPAFFMHQKTSEYYQAMTKCSAWRLGFDRFQELFHSIADFREAGRTRLVGSYFVMKNRNIEMITKSAKERYETLFRQHPEVIKNASLKHIATLLGITDTSLSRIRKEMASGSVS